MYQELYVDIEKTGGAPRPPADPNEMLRYPVTHPHFFKWMERGYLEMLDFNFRSRPLKEVLCTLTSYLTDKPETLTAMQMVPIFGCYFDGSFCPRGGPSQLSEAIAEIARAYGGTIPLGRKVARILAQNGTVYRVQLADGNTSYAGVVASNADARVTFRELIGLEHLPKAFARKVQDL